MEKLTLWRSAQDPYLNSDTTSFARRRADAEAYRTNPGYGGAHLYKVRVGIDPNELLDLTERIPRWLQQRVDRHGAVRVEEAIGAFSDVSDEIARQGFRWVRLLDSFPEDAETFILIGSDARVEDAMEAQPEKPFASAVDRLPVKPRQQRPRDPKTAPQRGDVLVVDLPVTMLGGQLVEHHLAVVDRMPRKVSVLAGPWRDGVGSDGGSPMALSLLVWRNLASAGRISVRAEESSPQGWGAIQESWRRTHPPKIRPSSPVSRLPARQGYPRWAGPPEAPGTGPNLREVAPGLWVGSEFAAAEPPTPEGRWGLIIDMREGDPGTGRWARKYLRLRVVDGQPIPHAHLDQALHAYQQSVGPTLVHCHWGLSRSPSVAAALLIVEHGLSEAEATRRVSPYREDADPNDVIWDDDVDGAVEWPRRATINSVLRWARTYRPTPS